MTGARLYYERALAIFEKVLGPYYPHTGSSLNNLDSLLRTRATWLAPDSVTSAP